MKFHIIISSALLILSLLLTSCFEDGICVNADGNIVTESVSLPAFSGVKLGTKGKINLILGDSIMVEVTGSENIVDLLDMDVTGDVLKIDVNNRCTRNTDLVFDITLPELTSVTISGAGEIVTDSLFTVTDIAVDISGSGSIDLSLDADHIETGISGSGDMNLSGTANSLSSRISGSGDVYAFGLDVLSADLRINGSGGMQVNVADELKAKISGSGDIFYKGTPAITVDISGSGKLEDAN